MRELLFLNGLSPAENRAFAVVLAVLLSTLIVLILIAVRRSAAAKKARPAAPAAYRPPVTVPPPQAAIPVREDHTDGKTMDEHYARVHGQWVCPFCETLNDDTLAVCRACGQTRG